MVREQGTGRKALGRGAVRGRGAKAGHTLEGVVDRLGDRHYRSQRGCAHVIG
jgi:hypothetical protein